MMSEPSEDVDFYINTGRSAFTKLSSQASVEVKGGDFAGTAFQKPQIET